jgi:ketopantoate reductase
MIVVGAGRIGTALQVRAHARGLDVTLVDRTSGWEALAGPPGAPILLAVRNADLSAVLAQVPRRRHEDLVFLQNGAIRELLAEHGLHHATRGVLYQWAAERGRDFVAARWSPLTGPHADALERWFLALDLPAESVHPMRFVVYEVEKLLWLTVFGWLCRAHQATVGEVAERCTSEVDALARELLPVTRAAWGIDLEAAWIVERLLVWSRAIPDFRASTSEDAWRGGWLQERARRYDVGTPMFDHLRQL